MRKMDGFFVGKIAKMLIIDFGDLSALPAALFFSEKSGFRKKNTDKAKKPSKIIINCEKIIKKHQKTLKNA